MGNRKQNKQWWYALETVKHGRTFHSVYAPDSDEAWDLGWWHAQGVEAMEYHGPKSSPEDLAELLYEIDNDV